MIPILMFWGYGQWFPPYETFILQSLTSNTSFAAPKLTFTFIAKAPQ